MIDEFMYTIVTFILVGFGLGVMIGILIGAYIADRFEKKYCKRKKK